MSRTLRFGSAQVVATGLEPVVSLRFACFGQLRNGRSGSAFESSIQEASVWLSPDLETIKVSNRAALPLATLPCSVRLRFAASPTGRAQLRRPIDVNDVLYLGAQIGQPNRTNSTPK